MTTTIRAATLSLAAAAGTLALAPPATALSCVEPAQVVAGSAHVFVGSVSDVSGASVRFDVQEVWKGHDLPSRVWLEREPDMDVWLPFSVDGRLPDGYSSPERHLVAVGRDLRVSPCQLLPVTSPEEYDVDGPARPPETGPDGGVEPEVVEPDRSSIVPLATGGAGALGAGAVAGLLWWRRRSP